MMLIGLRSLERFRCRCYNILRDEVEAMITEFYREHRFMWE